MTGVVRDSATREPLPGVTAVVGDGSGRHVFTRTYAEHQSAVAEYLKRYRAQRTPQAPQWSLLVATEVSQPFLPSKSQSAWPAAQGMR